MKNLAGMAFVIVAVATSVAAQTNTVTTSGTTSSGSVPVFNGTATVTNSPISVSGSNVGIGTSPQGPLDVNGRIGAQSVKVLSSFSDLVNNAPWYGIGASSLLLPDSDGGDAIQFAGYYGLNFQTSMGQMVITEHGNVGIGTITPTAPLQIHTSYTSATGGLDSSQGFLWSNNTNFSSASYGPQDNRILAMTFDPTTGAPAIRNSSSAKLGFISGGWYFSGGSVGIGTTTPGSALEVNGSVKLTSGSGASITYQDGTSQNTAWTGVLCGGDYAEAMNAAGGKSKYQPGDVLVLADGNADDVQKSAESYSTMVAGIYATKPGVIGRREALAKSTTDIPMAMVGVVPTKVSAENGPIRKGDLLVSSSIPGYAMKGTDRSRMLGAVIGKAMQPLDQARESLKCW